MRRSYLRYCCVLVLLSMLLGMFPLPAVSAEGVFSYLIAEGEVIITGYTGEEETVTVPAELEGFPVTTIGEFAFESGGMKELILPESIRVLEDGAFYDCAALERVTLGGGIAYIGEVAFADCVRLQEVHLPAALEVLGLQAFSGCDSLAVLTVGEGCETYSSAGNCIIETATGALLAGCGTSVIPDDGSVTVIAPYAFSCVRSLTALTIPKSVTEIGEGAFERTGLSVLAIPAEVIKVGKYILHGTALSALYCGAKARPVGWDKKWDSGVSVAPIWGYDESCSHAKRREDTVAPTCTQDGTKKIVCASCESLLSVEILPATGHTEKTETVESSCDKAGYTRVVCTVCKKELSRESLPLSEEHGELRTEAATASCTREGYINQVCTRCNRVVSSVAIPPRGHQEKTETVQPTCIKAGYTRVICTSCHKELSRREIPATGVHSDLRTETTPPTCTADGVEKQICKVCGAVEATKVLPATGHTEKTETVLPTCAADGYTRVICTVCGEELSRTELPKTEEHPSFEETTIPPTCRLDGVKQQACTLCGTVVSAETIPATGHTEKTETVSPTCGAAGYTRVICTVCGEELSRTELPATGEHPSFKTETVPPTCTGEGYEKKTCTLCGKEISLVVLPAAGHTEQTETVAPTCGAAGYTRVTCTVCGEELSYAELPKTQEHPSFKTETVPPTCTGEGYEKKTCTLCGKETSVVVLPATGHQSKTETVAPTCRKAGYLSVTCTVCGVQESYTILLATGHSYGEDGNCRTCGIPTADPWSEFLYSTDAAVGVTILGYVGTDDTVVIPANVLGLAVVKIGDGAFEGSSIKSIVLPHTIKEIGKFAFEGCSSLTEIILPDGVKLIDQGAFMDCTSLAAVYLPEGVETISYAAFAGCEGLSAVTLPASLRELASGAFYGCTALTHLAVRAGNEIYRSAENCILEISTGTLLMGCKTSVIPTDGSVKAIAEGAFDGVSGLQVLYLPEGITSIGAYAFRGTSLNALLIPGTVTEVGRYILFDTPAQQVYCPCEERPLSWHPNWIAGSEAEVIVYTEACPHEERILSREIPSGCLTVGCEFYCCSACGMLLRTVKNPPLGHTYSNGICKTCRLPKGLELELADGAYHVVGYSGTLSVVVIPEAVDGIPILSVRADAFSGNATVTKVYLPASILFVDENAFAGCSNLTELLCGRAYAPSTWDESWAWGFGGTVSWCQDPPENKKILYGDVNCDGKITVLDYGALKRYVMGTFQLTPDGILAADVNGDGRINAIDYARVKGHVLRTFQINQDR